VGVDSETPIGDARAAPRARSSSADSIALATLATIRDVSAEVVRLVHRTATRMADGTPVAPLLRSVFGEPALIALTHRDSANGLDGDTWAARVADAEQALAIGVQRATELQERHESTLADLREAHQRERALQAELAATLERSCAERETITRRADETVVAIEAQRAAAAREAEAARSALAAVQQSSLALRNELALSRSETIRLAAAAHEAQLAREQLEREQATVRTQLNTSQERLRTAQIELAHLGEGHRRAERATLGEHAERETRWQDELSGLRLEHARERDRAQALAEEIERHRVEAEARERREQRLQEELRAVSTRADVDRDETVRRAQEMVEAAEAARAAATAELEAVRASFSSDRARLLQMQAEHEKVEQGVTEREAALETANAMIAQLEATRASIAADGERARARLAETESELLAVRNELGLAQRQLDRLCTAHDDLIDDHARASAFLEEARATEATLRAQMDELREQIRSLEAERARLVAMERQRGACTEEQSVSSARASELETELESLRGWSRTLEGEIAQATAALEQAAFRERRLQDALTASEQSERLHQETLVEAQALAQTVEAERAAVVAELEALRTTMASTQRVILEAEEETRVARVEAERLAVAHEATLTEQARLRAAKAERAAAPTPETKTRAAAPPSPGAVISTDTRVVAVLDTSSEWPTIGGVDVQIVAPGNGVVGRIGELAAGRCIVNLAAAGAIEAAAELRQAGVGVPLWGAIIVPSGERGLSLGQIEVLSRPIDPDLVRSQCATIAPKNARMLAIGSDSATFIALRQGLMKAGMSVSIAWDLKQATELMEIVRPHMVVLDLALPSRGAAALVADLARLETPPILVVLPGKPEQVATFSAALSPLVPIEGSRSQQSLLRAVIDAKR
jgi:hypothetical protein